MRIVYKKEVFWAVVTQNNEYNNHNRVIAYICSSSNSDEQFKAPVKPSENDRGERIMRLSWHKSATNGNHVCLRLPMRNHSTGKCEFFFLARTDAQREISIASSSSFYSIRIVQITATLPSQTDRKWFRKCN